VVVAVGVEADDWLDSERVGDVVITDGLLLSEG
jgi:hypothetical protein